MLKQMFCLILDAPLPELELPAEGGRPAYGLRQGKEISIHVQ